MILKRAICDQIDDPVVIDAISQLKTGRSSGIYNTRSQFQAKKTPMLAPLAKVN